MQAPTSAAEVSAELTLSKAGGKQRPAAFSCESVTNNPKQITE